MAAGAAWASAKAAWDAECKSCTDAIRSEMLTERWAAATHAAI